MGQKDNALPPEPQADAEDAFLLRRFVRDKSQAAFTALVRRYGGLVHATCLREVDDPHLAEDATQVVFLLLARKAPSLLRLDSLAGWLFRASRFSARNALRNERRRRTHEQEVIADMTQRHLNGPPLPSWDHLEPVLNAALASLRPHEQEVVLVRYLEGASWRETAARLGLAEDAAQKRGTRAVDKMRRFVNHQGLMLSLAALTALLSEEAARAAPLPAVVVAKTVGTVTGGGLSGPNVTALYQGVLQMMKMTNIAATFGGLVLVGTVGGVLTARSLPTPRTPQQRPGQVLTQNRASQVAMAYRDFASVRSPRNPSAPLQLVMGKEAGGRQMTAFVVAAPWHGFPPGQTFRDGAHIASDRAAHKGRAAQLKAELRAWNMLLKDSPVILTQADLEPKCQAHLLGNGTIPTISQTFTPSGTEKFARFTKDHTGGVIGIIIDNRILSATVINEPILDSHVEISGGFASLNEARVLAHRLNEAAGGRQGNRT